MKKTLRANLTLFMSLALIMTVLFAVPASAEEHVIFGDFEKEFDAEKPEWTVSTGAEGMISRKEEGGNHYIEIKLSGKDNATGKDAALVQKTEGTDNVKIKMNTSYKLSFKAKADAPVSPYVYVRLRKVGGTSMDFNFKFENKLCATDSWTEFTAYFVTENATWEDTAVIDLLEIKLKASPNSLTTPIYYDDISIVEGVAPIVHTELLTNGKFDKNIDGWTFSDSTLSSYISHAPEDGVDGSGAVKFDLSQVDMSNKTNDEKKIFNNAAIVSTSKLAIGKIYRLTFSMKSNTAGIKPVIYYRNQWKPTSGSNVNDEQYNMTLATSPFAECSTTGWTTYSCTFHTFPEKNGTALEGASLIKNELKLKVSSVSAVIWYDNVSIVEDYNECTFGDKDGNIVNAIPTDGEMTVKYHRVNNTDKDTTAALYFAVYEIQGKTKLLK